MKPRWLPLLPALWIAVLLAAAWPGYLSFDSALQFWQARHGTFFDIAPPLLPALWWLSLKLGLPATSGPLLLIGVAFAAGFGLLVQQAARAGQRPLAWTLALLGPLCPLLLLLLAQIWTDVLLAGTLLLLAAVIAGAERAGRGRWLAVLLLGFIGCGLRHNSVLAVLPLLLWAVWRWSPSRLQPAGRIMLGLLLTALLWFGKQGLGAWLVEQRLDTWAIVPLHDLQAVSVATGAQRLPASVVGPGMDVGQLEKAFHPYSVTTLFAQTTSGVSDPTVGPLQPQQRADLLAAWRRLPFEAAWWTHRLRMFRGLLGSHRADELKGLADSPGLQSFRDNPPLERALPGWHERYRAALDALRDSWAYAAGLYLGLGLLAGALWWRRRPQPPAPWPGLAGALLASAWVYTLPYFVIAPSAETRYLLWPALASWLAAITALGVRAIRAPATRP